VPSRGEDWESTSLRREPAKRPDTLPPAARETATLSVNRMRGLLLVGVSVAMAWILLPFYGAILWASIIALLFMPLYLWLLPRLKGRRSLAALLTMGAALVSVILPAALLLVSLAHEASLVYAQLQSGELDPARLLRGFFEYLPAVLGSLLAHFGLDNFDLLQRRLVGVLTQGSGLIATHTLSIGQDAFHLVLSVFITVYLAFFFVRDGDSLLRSLRRAIPMATGDKQDLVDKFGVVLRATVKGNLIVAVVQGALGGLAFWFLGIGGALLWAVLMAVLSLLPVVGPALVWLPLALWLFVTGSLWQGIGLTVFGVLVIGLADNFLRPLLVGRDTGMPDYLVLITTLGGIVLLGINGFVVGPTVAAMFIAVWHIQTSAQPGSP
jgi:predicted PurR-regulated permease PerM